MIVTDVTVFGHLFVDGPRSAAARRSLAGEDDWVVADFCRAQLADVLTGHVRGGGLTVEAALGKLLAFGRVVRRSHEQIGDSDALGLARDELLSASQATVILIARRLDVPLVTADADIVLACPDHAVSIDTFGAP